MRIHIDKVSKKFGSHPVLQNISLDIHSEEFLSLLGPSGCGKTTLLRLLAGLEQVDSGDILFDRQSVLFMPSEKREIGFVFQNYALFPHMSVYENVAYGLRFIDKKLDRRARVHELLELVQLRSLDKRMPSELSAGQQQRVALARALAPRPKLLLLDEPLSALDAALRVQLRFEIKKIQRALRMTMIYVTHDQDEALAISDRIAIMNCEQIEQIDTPQNIYQQPRTVFVARFVGRTNLIKARLLSSTIDELQIQLSSGQQFRSPKHLLNKANTDAFMHLIVRPSALTLGISKKIKLSGVWRGAEFLGDSYMGHIESESQEFLIKLNMGAQLPAEGSEIIFSFDPNDCLIL